MSATGHVSVIHITEETGMETGIPEDQTAHSKIETDLASRPTIVDEIRSVMPTLPARSAGGQGWRLYRRSSAGIRPSRIPEQCAIWPAGPAGNQREFVRLRGRGAVRRCGEHLYGDASAHRQQASQGWPVRIQRCVDRHRDGRLHQQGSCSRRSAERLADLVHRAGGGILDHPGPGVRLHDKE